MRKFVGSLALAAAAPLMFVGHAAAQDSPTPPPPDTVEQAPLPQPEAEYPPHDGSGVFYEDGGPAYVPQEAPGAVPPGPGCDPLAAPALTALLPQPFYCPQAIPGMLPMGCQTPPLSPISGLCCLPPLQTTSAWCPPPVAAAAPWCPPAAVGLPVASTPVPPLPICTGVVAGYPFSTAPIYSNSCATWHTAHPMRKDALWHVSPGNMFPMQPIAPIAKGSYYFRPYNFRQVQIDQMHAALWTGNTAEPYTSPLLPALATKLHNYKDALDKALLPSLGGEAVPAPGILAPLAPPMP